ncbi:MAG: methyltransferase [Firmicutes bacterium]|nr:methyltransferase [Bacillota bacterium]
MNAECTWDDLRIGGFSLLQPKKGYRFSLDAPLLAALVPLDGVDSVLDLGCGGGVLPLLLLGREPHLQVTGIEKQEVPFALAEQNRKRNGVEMELILGDAMVSAELLKGRIFDLILSNPPYYAVGACRLPQNEDIAAAKTEVYWNQKTMMEQAFSLLKENGRFGLIFDGRRGEEMISLGIAAGFGLEKRIDVFTKAEHSEADRVYLQFYKGSLMTSECDSLVVYEQNGEMTPKMKRILEIYHGTGTVPCGDSHR